jgi:FkbM family methyltransferase
MFPWALAGKTIASVARRQGKMPELLYWCAETYRNAHDNWNYDAASNGEFNLLHRLRYLPIDVVFDVGANIGEWSTQAMQCFPDAMIHAFEIAPETFDKLAASCAAIGSIACHHFGLSNNDGDAALNYTAANDLVSSLVDVQHIHRLPFTQRTVQVQRGDAFCRGAGIDRIDILKIDVEGAEHLVMQGFGDWFDDGRIGLVQFEYGQANILTRNLLADYWTFFEPRGYRIGRLMPDGVAFQDYSYDVEDFRGPNYVAVHESRPEMLDALARRR